MSSSKTAGVSPPVSIHSASLVTQHTGEGDACYSLLQRWYQQYIQDPGSQPAGPVDTWCREAEEACLHLLLNKHAPHCTVQCLLLHLQCLKCLLRRLCHPYQVQEHYPAIPPVYCNALYRVMALKPIAAPWKDRRNTVHHLFLALQSLLSSPHLSVRYAAEQCLELWLCVLAPPEEEEEEEEALMPAPLGATWLHLSRGNMETRSVFAIYLLWLLEPIFVGIHPREHECTIPSPDEVMTQGWGALRVMAAVLSRHSAVAAQNDAYLILCDLALSGSNLVRDCYHALCNGLLVLEPDQEQGRDARERSRDTQGDINMATEQGLTGVASHHNLQAVGLHVQSIITYLGILSYIVNTPPPFPDGPPAGSLKVVSCAVVHASGLLQDLGTMSTHQTDPNVAGPAREEVVSLSRDLYNAMWKFVWDTREHVLFDHTTGLADAILSSLAGRGAGRVEGQAAAAVGSDTGADAGAWGRERPIPWPEVILHAVRISLNALTTDEHGDGDGVHVAHARALQQIAHVLEHTQLFRNRIPADPDAQGGQWEEVDDDEIARRLLAAISMYEALIPLITRNTHDVSDIGQYMPWDGLRSTWHPMQLMYQFVTQTSNDVSVALDMLMDDSNGDLLSFILRFLTIMTGSFPSSEVVESIKQQKEHEQAVRRYVFELGGRLKHSLELGTFPYNAAPLVRRISLFLEEPE
eukprot:TRINITY_DN1740_c1_g1_i1.p1 TRINITY_DN1740_c1_g1~~TRINITY_DN1740_c1_g1_i1.p1  ORF type:complete len:693 (-),score=79.23 TRINITY_DN1740_c1_g1_i1:20-2098(-)